MSAQNTTPITPWSSLWRSALTRPLTQRITMIVPSLTLRSMSLTAVELLQCGYAVDSKSLDHPTVSAGPDGNPGFSAVH